MRPIILLSSVALASCGTVHDLPAKRIGGATLSLASGVPAGTAQLLAQGDQVTLAVAVTGISPGAHGIHLHTVGSCGRPDFTSAGAHLNPLGRKHGSLSAGGKHEGDLPNITIGAGGSGSLSAVLGGTPDQIRDWVFDDDGTAIVVHAAADDYMTDPAGNSGARIACGLFKPAQGPNP